MSVPAKKIEVEYPMEAQLARLEERTEHIQKEVSEIKGDIRRLDAKVDGVKDSITKLAVKIGSMETTMVKWTIGTLIAALTLAFGVSKFFN
jgi:peptidoglycan hydrolase CwlO-like protein